MTVFDQVEDIKKITYCTAFVNVEGNAINVVNKPAKKFLTRFINPDIFLK